MFTLNDWAAGTGELVTHFVVVLSYDPDISLDGNPDNDDCNPRNNTVRVTSEQLKSILESGTGWHSL